MYWHRTSGLTPGIAGTHLETFATFKAATGATSALPPIEDAPKVGAVKVATRTGGPR
jgi:hypothetical protein